MVSPGKDPDKSKLKGGPKLLELSLRARLKNDTFFPRFMEVARYVRKEGQTQTLTSGHGLLAPSF